MKDCGADLTEPTLDQVEWKASFELFIRHAPVIWLVEDDARLGTAVKIRLRQGGDTPWALSDLTLLEIAMLVSKKRIELELPVAEYLGVIAARFKVYPVSAQIAAKAMSLELPYSDPFDRVILATAQVPELTLITRDQKMTESGLVSVLW